MRINSKRSQTDERKIIFNQASFKAESEILIRNRFCAAFGMCLAVGTQRVNYFMSVCFVFLTTVIQAFVVMTFCYCSECWRFVPKPVHVQSAASKVVFFLLKFFRERKYLDYSYLNGLIIQLERDLLKVCTFSFI